MKRLLQYSKFFQKTASMLVIGNEILSGDTIDTNSGFLAKFLTENGVKLEEIRTIPDIQSSIERNVLEMSPLFDFVFTSGGIGSTHDDITYESIASAFNVELEINPLVEERIRDIIPENRLCDATFRMATLPVSYPDSVRLHRIVGTNLPESFISDPLRDIAEKYSNIEIGSYPNGRRKEDGVNVSISISSFHSNEDEVEACVNEILENIDSFEIY